MKSYLCVAALLVLPAAAFAQGNPGPFGGLFGRAPHRTGADYRVFEIRGSGGGQWDDSLSGQPRDELGRMPSGVLGDTAGEAVFQRRTDRLNLEAGTTVDYRRTLTSRPVGGTSADGGLKLSSRVTTRVTAEVVANYRYSPFFQFYPSYLWADSGLVVPGTPFAATAVGSHSSEGRIGGAFQYSKSSTLRASTSRLETQFPTRRESSMTVTGYDGLWQRRLNRDFAVRLGYARSTFRYHQSPVAAFVQEDLDAGVDFNRALTPSPRTTIAFTSNTSILRRNRERHYRLNGSVILSQRFRRTWEASIKASRETQLIVGFVEPMFVDVLAVSMSGLLADRVEWITTVNGRKGDIGFDGSLGQLAIAGAITQFNIAVTRHVGIYTQYALYHHDVRTDASSIALPGRLSRQMVSTGITAWLPVFIRERTPSDSR